MHQRGLNTVVVLFWLTTMTWLVVTKVLPPLERGEPPSYQSFYGGLDPKAAPICWDVTWNDQPIGWAVCWSDRPLAGMLEIRSWVHFQRLPLQDMAPVWMRSLLQSAGNSLNRLEMDACNQLEFDPLNRLSGFRSSIQLAHIPEAIVVHGTVDGSRLKLRVDAGDVAYCPPDTTLPPDALLGDQISPQSKMPGLHVGQSWTVPVYNPLQPDSPMEVLQAIVEGHEPIAWDGHGVDTLVVVYRSDPGSALGTARLPHSKLWVDSAGTVLQQETWLFGSRLAFVRLGKAATAARRAMAGDKLSEVLQRAGEKSDD